MPYNPDLHPLDKAQGKHRRSIRLREYDYTQVGAYFVTIVTNQREPLFGEIVDGAVKLSALGEIAWQEWFKTTELRPYVELYEDEFVVMPNHAHGIINIVGANTGAERRSVRTTPHVDAGSLGAVVRAYKSAVTYAINAARQTRGKVVWQRNYYEHIVRNDADLNRIRKYIAENPLKWAEDDLYS